MIMSPPYSRLLLHIALETLLVVDICLYGVVSGYMMEAVQGNHRLEAELLVLSVETMKGGPCFDPVCPPGTTLTNAETCAQFCKKLPGCNAYSFCGQPDGCEGDCAEHVTQNPKVAADTPLPVRGFGPLTYPPGGSGCHYNGTLQQGVNRWPYAMCSLMRANQTVKEIKGAGWSSGVFHVPEECGPNVPLELCEVCLVSMDKQRCLGCAQVNAPSSMDSSVLGLLPLGQSRCQQCAMVVNPDARQSCFDCVMNSRPCQLCADAAGPAAIESCLACSNRTGLISACKTCASSPHNMSCFSCLDDLRHHYCNATHLEGNTTYCTPTEEPYLACDVCSRHTRATEYCMSCLKQSPSNKECQVCGGIDQHTTDARPCFECAMTPGASGCFSCYTFTMGMNHRDEARKSCLQCVMSPETPAEVKPFCAPCVSYMGSSRQAERCYSCIRAPISNVTQCFVTP